MSGDDNARIRALEATVKALEFELVKEKEEKAQLKSLGKGTFFTQMKDLLTTEPVPYKDGFKKICGRFADKEWRKKRFQVYSDLVTELTKKVQDANETASGLTLQSESESYRSLDAKSESDLSQSIKSAKKNRFESKANRDRLARLNDMHKSDPTFAARVTLIEAGTVTNKAHLLEGNRTCSQTMGILVQPMVGMDFEAAMDKQIKTKQKEIDEGRGGEETQVEALQAKKIKILQQLAYHKRPPYIGFINLENNGVNVPKHGHERFYDETCNWIIVPIMTLQNIINWHHEKGEYWVMCIAGDLETDNYGAYRNLIQASQSEDENEVIYVDGREKCTPDDVKNGIANLSAFICAFADLATGRGANKITPLDLVEKDQEPTDLVDLKKAANRLKKYKQVLVPELQSINFDAVEIMKLRIGHGHLTSKLPEPMAFAAKGALNFMSLTGEKATPGCCRDEEESEEEENESFAELHPSSVTPVTPPRVPQSISIVTPSPSQVEWISSPDKWDL